MELTGERTIRITNPELCYNGVEIVPYQQAEDIAAIRVRILREIAARGNLAPHGFGDLDGSNTRDKEIFLIKYRDSNVGYAALSYYAFERTAVPEIAILPEYRGRGIGAVTLLLLMKFAFEVVGMYKVESVAFSHNGASIAMQRRFMAEEGVIRSTVYWRGEYRDKHIFGLIRPEWEECKEGYYVSCST